MKNNKLIEDVAKGIANYALKQLQEKLTAAQTRNVQQAIVKAIMMYGAGELQKAIKSSKPKRGRK